MERELADLVDENSDKKVTFVSEVRQSLGGGMKLQQPQFVFQASS